LEYFTDYFPGVYSDLSGTTYAKIAKNYILFNKILILTLWEYKNIPQAIYIFYLHLYMFRIFHWLLWHWLFWFIRYRLRKNCQKRDFFNKILILTLLKYENIPQTIYIFYFYLFLFRIFHWLFLRGLFWSIRYHLRKNEQKLWEIGQNLANFGLEFLETGIEIGKIPRTIFPLYFHDS